MKNSDQYPAPTIKITHLHKIHLITFAFPYYKMLFVFDFSQISIYQKPQGSFKLINIKTTLNNCFQLKAIYTVSNRV